MANGNGSPRGFVGKLVDSLENRLVLLVMATILGMGGNLAINKGTPEARSDPFTGTQGTALALRVEKLEKVFDVHEVYLFPWVLAHQLECWQFRANYVKSL